MKKIFVELIILAIIAIIFALPFISKKKEIEKLTLEAPEAVILFMEGDVKVKDIETNRWQDARVDMVLSQGDSLKTGINSWAEIGFGEDYNNVIRIKENTLMELTDLGPIKLGLLKGEIRSLVEELEEDSTFEIATPTAICGARGTGWDTATDGQKVIVDTYENEVFLNRLSKNEKVIESSIIAAGKRGIIKEPSKPIVIENLPVDRTRDWDEWKDDFIKRSAKETDKVSKGKASEGRPKVWVEELEEGDYQLMVSDEEDSTQQ